MFKTFPYGGGSIGLLYIIDHKKYKKHLETGFYKYGFRIFMPEFKSKILNNITKEEHVIGDVAGINLKPIDYKNPDKVDKLISSILKIKDEKHNLIYMEEINLMDYEIISAIEKGTSLKFPKGLDISLYNLPIILKEIFDKNNMEGIKKEVLIICQYKEMVYNIVNFISHMFKFISVIGIPENEKEEVYEAILKDTGISIFQPKNIDRNIRNYDIIINLSNELLVKVINIKRKSIVIDFSITKPFKSMDNPMVITDISLDITDSSIRDNDLIEDEISSRLYEGIFKNEHRTFCRLYSKNNLYNVEELANRQFQIKGEF
ncbi:hypothetical protein [Wansuia hejianensis]|uniref:Uncharacterized protein n=1 Tax=Wansuia hejianensis TaxID=2763667 RepID=A0A926IP24_9FIRM|nr:hypothetical protein [Wansuia hejianensis]MBC8591253.1 hypothetical protein [Wansuia hejianensis]